jgi:hypothetical protein
MDEPPSLERIHAKACYWKAALMYYAAICRGKAHDLGLRCGLSAGIEHHEDTSGGTT